MPNVPCKINFLLPYGAKLDIYNGNTNIHENIVSVEPFLEGEYIKFNNNDGAPFGKILISYFFLSLHLDKKQRKKSYY